MAYLAGKGRCPAYCRSLGRLYERRPKLSLFRRVTMQTPPLLATSMVGQVTGDLVQSPGNGLNPWPVALPLIYLVCFVSSLFL